MFVPVWLIFLTSGLAMAIYALVWSLRTRQFDDQQRARFLPLSGLTAEEMAAPPAIKRGASFYALIFIVVCGLASIALTIAVMIKHW